MRTQHVIGNWKMNGTHASNAALLSALNQGWVASARVRVAVCPPAIYIPAAQIALRGSMISVGAQDVSEHSNGAYTGQMSAAMLADQGLSLVLVGHSERRQGLGETNEQVARKAASAIAAGMTPLVCVGETLSEREDARAQSVVLAQLQAVIDRLGGLMTQIVVAYEPVWAIGTGMTALPADAQAMHAVIRAALAGCGAESVSVLYGGSVKADNAATLFSMPDIDGGLIGGASLDAAAFLAICRALDSQ